MSERWKPEKDEEYYFFAYVGDVEINVWDDDSIDEQLFERGNCFKTKAEAQAAAEKIKALLLSLHCDETLPANDESLQDKQLPKLTVEVFDRPDCPEWAKYAAVNKNGLCFFYHNKPDYGVCNYAGKWYVDDCKYAALIGEKFDPSDWQNSLIERTAKLPDWCKVGRWVYADGKGGYGKVYEIKDYIRVKMENGRSVNQISEYKINELSRTRLRPYNAEEMKALVGKVIATKEDIALVVGYRGCQNKVVIGMQENHGYFSAEKLLDWNVTIDGKPAGVFEHLENGEWVK